MAERDRTSRIFEEMQAADAMRQGKSESGPDKGSMQEFLGSLGDRLEAAFADIRHKVVEQGVYGRSVTPEAIEVHTHAPGVQPYSYADYCRDNGLDKKAPETPAQPEAPSPSIER